jgi:hypothetical protein
MSRLSDIRTLRRVLASLLALLAAAIVISATMLGWGGRMTFSDILIGGTAAVVTLALLEYPYLAYAVRVKTVLGSMVGGVALGGTLVWASFSTWNIPSGESPLTLLSLWLLALLEGCAVILALVSDRFALRAPKKQRT